MTIFYVVTALAAGVGLGLVTAYLFGLMRAKTARELAGELFRESEAQRQTDIDAVVANMKESFGNLSLEALSRSSNQLMELAKSELGAAGRLGARELGEKKGLIDQQLKTMTDELGNVSRLIRELEKDRELKFGELSAQLKTAGENTAELSQTTATLREALASTKARGQWGERMAEDVLRLAGFVENVNYVKQRANPEGRIPDFTFLLPKELKLNMDAKFPLDNYMRYLEADNDAEKARFSRDFIKDVKARVKEVVTREYVDPAGGTVDYVLLFIPSEQIYAFIHETDSSILDEAIRNKVIFCSPITLFAVLAVIRQAVDNFSLEQTSNEILSLLGTFDKQWQQFVNKMESLGHKIEGAHKDYEALVTTRQRQLEKPLNKINDIRTRRGLAAAAESSDDDPGIPVPLDKEHPAMLAQLSKEDKQEDLPVR